MQRETRTGRSSNKVGISEAVPKVALPKHHPPLQNKNHLHPRHWSLTGVGSMSSSTLTVACVYCAARGKRGTGSTCTKSRSGGRGRPGGELLGGGAEGGTGRTKASGSLIKSVKP